MHERGVRQLGQLTGGGGERELSVATQPAGAAFGGVPVLGQVLPVCGEARPLVFSGAEVCLHGDCVLGFGDVGERAIAEGIATIGHLLTGRS